MGIKREYGSEQHWQSRRDFETGRGGFELEGWQLFRSGRDALKAVAAVLRGRRAFLPALCCESMVLPFEQNCVKVEFYGLGADFKADVAMIKERAESGDLLLYMPWFDQQPFDEKGLAELRGSGMLLLEDRTHDILKRRPERFCPDYTVASLRKWAALPEGGLLKSTLTTAQGRQDERFARLRREAMEEKGEYLEKGQPEMKADFLEKLHRADRVLDESAGPGAMLDSSLGYIRSLDFEKILAARQGNCAVLARCLKDEIGSGKIRPVWDEKDPSSLYFPILVENRDELQRAMAQSSIYCPVIWPIVPEARGLCEKSEYLAEHILALPCDQRYDSCDMEHIALRLKDCLKGI